MVIYQGDWRNSPVTRNSQCHCTLWQNSHMGSSTCRVRAIMVGKVKCKPLGFKNCKLKQVMSQIAVAVADVVSLLDPLVLSMQVLIWKVLFALYLLIKTTWAVCFQLAKRVKYLRGKSILQTYRCDVLWKGKGNMVSRDHVPLSLPQDSALVHYISEIMLIGPSNQEVQLV